MRQAQRSSCANPPTRGARHAATHPHTHTPRACAVRRRAREERLANPSAAGPCGTAAEAPARKGRTLGSVRRLAPAISCKRTHARAERARIQTRVSLRPYPSRILRASRWARTPAGTARAGAAHWSKGGQSAKSPCLRLRYSESPVPGAARWAVSKAPVWVIESASANARPSPAHPQPHPSVPPIPSPKFGGATAALLALWPCKAQEVLADRHAPLAALPGRRVISGPVRVNFSNFKMLLF